jgi:hypothetical protein
LDSLWAVRLSTTRLYFRGIRSAHLPCTDRGAIRQWHFHHRSPTGTEPETPEDYEASDQELVFATAAQLLKPPDCPGSLELELIGESFNLLNRDNQRFQLTSDGLVSNAAQFVQDTKLIGNSYFPAYYQIPTNFMKVNGAYAPRQLQLALRPIY